MNRIIIVGVAIAGLASAALGGGYSTPAFSGASLEGATNALNTDVITLETSTNALNTRAVLLETATNSLNARAGTLETSTNALNARAGLLETATNYLNLARSVVITQSVFVTNSVNTIQVTTNNTTYVRNSTWQNLSLASYIPAGATMVKLYSSSVPTNENTRFLFGDANSNIWGRMHSFIAGQVAFASADVVLGPSVDIWYNTSLWPNTNLAGTCETIRINGWWIPQITTQTVGVTP